MANEQFTYRDYKVVVEGPVTYRGSLKVVAYTKKGPKFNVNPKCTCNKANGFFRASSDTIDRSQPSAQQEAEARRLTPLMKRRIKEAIDSHLLAMHS